MSLNWSEIGNNVWNFTKNTAAGLGNLVSTFFEPITHANENLQLQKDNLEYQKDIQQQIFNREDNSIQRSVADLQAAGLSKTLFGGGAGAGSVVSTSAPERESDLASVAAMANLATQMASISHTKEETRRLKQLNKLGQLDLDFYQKNNLSPAQQNKYMDLVTALGTVFDQVAKGWNNGGSVLEPVFNPVKAVGQKFIDGAFEVGNTVKGAVVAKAQEADSAINAAADFIAQGIEDNKIKVDYDAKRVERLQSGQPDVLLDYSAYVQRAVEKGQPYADFEKWSKLYEANYGVKPTGR